MLNSDLVKIPSNNYGYPKKNRLLKPSQFKSVFDNTSFKIHQPNLMAFVSKNQLNHARLGLAITKKKVPTAVVRNRLKRLIREQFRHKFNDLPDVDIVFITKRPITDLTNKPIVNEIDTVFEKLIKKVNHQ